MKVCSHNRFQHQRIPCRSTTFLTLMTHELKRRNECKTNEISSENRPEYSLLITTPLIHRTICHAGGQPSNKWLIPPPTASPFLLARNTPFGRGYRLNLVERPVTVTGIELPRMVGSGQPSICSTRLRFFLRGRYCFGYLKNMEML
ncbi:hypothetical protein CEXT_168251 [Caerostris extrusa]|uniref:Uncharacterized protein n=1 Tax=Caerostris extrusa TaxID=172846 RepID=A0AAV4Q7V9_CAEEX|nr:hypothetical protein CEXT_168251 [Caerostris extrusa]